ncbi:MAG: type II toxin-antitoxin system RelE/ParE family toxin [Hyphomonadaceae bacterium]
MKIYWRAEARADLEQLLDYIAAESMSGAARVMDRILTRVESLAELPRLGRPGRRPDIRELVIVSTPYIVVYRLGAEEIEILVVLHGAQLR